MRPSITPALAAASLTQLNCCELCGDKFRLIAVGSRHHLLPSQDLCRMGSAISFRLKAALCSTYRIGTNSRAISSLKILDFDRKFRKSRSRKLEVLRAEIGGFSLCFVLCSVCFVVAHSKRQEIQSTRHKALSSKRVRQSSRCPARRLYTPLPTRIFRRVGVTRAVQ